MLDNSVLFVGDQTMLKTVLSKLQMLTIININDEIAIDGDLLRIIADHCRELRQLKIRASSYHLHLTHNDMAYFGKKCGHKLRSLKIATLAGWPDTLADWAVRQLIPLTPNLKDTDIKLSQLLNDNLDNHSPLLPKLEEYYSCEHYFYNNFNLKELARFQKEYKGLAKLKLSFNHFTGVMISKALNILSEFHDLRELNLISGRMNLKLEDIAQGLRQMSVNSKHLTKLTVHLRVMSRQKCIGDNYLSVFGSFKQLVSLKIFFYFNDRHRIYGEGKPKIEFWITFGNIKELRDLKHLRHLSLGVQHLTEDTFKNMGQHLPELESIVLSNNIHITDTILEQISFLNGLKWLTFDDICLEEVSETGVNTFVDKLRLHLRIFRIRKTNHSIFVKNQLKMFASKAHLMTRTVLYFILTARMYLPNISDNIVIEKLLTKHNKPIFY